MKKSYFFVLVIALAGIVNGSSLFAQGKGPGPNQKSTLTGNWQYVGSGGFSSGEAIDLSLAFHPSGMPWVAFEEWGPPRLFRVMKFDGSVWADAGHIGDTVEGEWLGLDFDTSGTPMVGFRQPSGMIGLASVVHYDGSLWHYTGHSKFSAGDVYHTSLAVGPSGEPYIVYQDAANNSYGTVMMFDGSSWVNVGTPGFTQSFARNPVIAFSPGGTPYIAYASANATINDAATVMKFNGTSWEFVGIRGFSAGPVDSISLAFNPEGEPWVSYSDGAYSWKATVMRFNGTAWVNVGDPGFSPGAAGWTSIGFSQGGQAVVAFQDAGNSLKASAMIYDGSSWSFLGAPGFTADTVAWTRLKFSPAGQPYVAFNDWSNSQKVSVMMYDGPLDVKEIQKTTLSLYPDPAWDLLTIDPGTSADKLNRIEIYNILGSQVMTVNISGGITHLNIESLPSGIYFVKAYGAREFYTARFTRK